MLAIGACSPSDVSLNELLPPTLSVAATVPRTIVRSKVACSRCRLTLEPVVRLGSANGPQGLGGTGRRVKRDSRGRYLVVDINTAARQVFVFEPDGRYLKTFGGRGSGPGEYRFISQLFVLPGDSLRLHDAAIPRYTIYDPEYRVVRTEPYPPIGYLGTVLFADGRMVTNKEGVPGMTPRASRGMPFAPFYMLDAHGKVVRSFGAGIPDSAERRLFQRTTTLGRDGRLYAAHGQAYVIEVWDTLGVKQREIVRDAEWFRPWIKQPALATREPRLPYVTDIHDDEQGRLWVLLRVTQPGWEQQIERAPVREGEPPGTLMLGGVTSNRSYDTIVEVIDLATGRLLVSQRFDLWLYGMLDDGLVVSDGEDENLVSYVDIWRFRLLER